MELDIELGEIQVLVLGKHLPLRYQNHEENTAVANALAGVINDRLTTQFGGQFSIDIVSIQHGCIKIRLKIKWKKVKKAAKDTLVVVASLATIAASVQTLWGGEDSAPIVVVVNGNQCEAKFSTSNLKLGSSYKVKPDETLSQILEKFDYSSFTKKQVMVATYQLNMDCFINGNLNLLKQDIQLLLPHPEIVKMIDPDVADTVYQEHLRRFKEK